MTEPLRVVVTGAAGQIGYSLVYMIACGSVFGDEQPLILQVSISPTFYMCKKLSHFMISLPKRPSFLVQFKSLLILSSASRYCSGYGSPQRPSNGARRLRLPPRQEGRRNGRSSRGFQGHFPFSNFLVSGF